MLEKRSRSINVVKPLFYMVKEAISVAELFRSLLLAFYKMHFIPEKCFLTPLFFAFGYLKNSNWVNIAVYKSKGFISLYNDHLFNLILVSDPL